MAVEEVVKRIKKTNTNVPNKSPIVRVVEVQAPIRVNANLSNFRDLVQHFTGNSSISSTISSHNLYCLDDITQLHDIGHHPTPILTTNQCPPSSHDHSNDHVDTIPPHESNSGLSHVFTSLKDYNYDLCTSPHESNSSISNIFTSLEDLHANHVDPYALGEDDAHQDVVDHYHDGSRIDERCLVNDHIITHHIDIVDHAPKHNNVNHAPKHNDINHAPKHHDVNQVLDGVGSKYVSTTAITFCNYQSYTSKYPSLSYIIPGGSSCSPFTFGDVEVSSCFTDLNPDLYCDLRS